MARQEESTVAADGNQDIAPRWRDDPISTVDQDQLRRAPFARHAARLINDNHSDASSVVYGLEGPWGSGKSSVIALITSFLTGAAASQWRVVHFTPWATTGTDGLLEEFFAALSTVAPEAGADRRLRDRIVAYASIARPVAAVVPVIGSGLAEVSRAVEERLRKPWNVAFAEVSEELRRLNTPILVVVDDIDRLQPSELFDLLRVVRLLGRFPGVDFLLAYDEQTLVATLQDPARGRVSTARARSFMEKIVQYPLSMPPLLTGKIVKMLSAGLTAIVTPERVEASFDAQRFSRIILTTMPSQLSTPRAIERFLAQVREQFRIHDLDEMNDTDLILKTFLRVEFPDLFAQLQRWKVELTRGSAGVLRLSSRDDSELDWNELLSYVEDEQDRQDAREVLQALFPAVNGRNAMRAKAGRFAHPDYFDRYLAQTIPEGDIPDAAVSRALSQAATGNRDELFALVRNEDDEQATLALNKIQARYPDIGEPWSRVDALEGPATVELLSAGMTLIDALEDRRASWSSALSQTTYWMVNLLRLILDVEPDAEVDRALACCTDAQRRARVISSAARNLDNVRPETQQALHGALQRQSERLLPLWLRELRRRDDADSETGSIFLVTVLQEAGLLTGLALAVQEGMQAGDFTLEDVAARFVSFSYLVGGPARPSSASFYGGLFTELTGVDAVSTDHDERGEWTDTSWPRRREFAARFLRPAPDATS